MIKNRYFPRIAFLVVAMGLAGMLFACSSASTSEETAEEKPETTETVVKIELSFIIDEEFDAAMTEVQALYSKEHKDIGFTENRVAIPEEALEQKSEKVLDGLTPNDLANTDDEARKKSGKNVESVADFFLTSSPEGMDEIEELDFTDLTTRFDMLTTELVIVAKKDSPIKKVEWSDITSGSYQVALGDAAMPEGNAARQALSTSGAYLDPTAGADPNASGGEAGYQNFSPLIGSSFEEITAFLEEEKADLAVMYASDAAKVQGLKVVGEAPLGTYRAPQYPAAASLDSAYPEETEAFLAWATSNEEAQKVWQKHGFSFPS